MPIFSPMDNTISRKEAVRRRMRAMSLLEDGLTHSQVARRLGVSYAAVAQCAKAQRERGRGAAATPSSFHPFQQRRGAERAPSRMD